MMSAAPEYRVAAGYLLALCAGIVVYLRYGVARDKTDVGVLPSTTRLLIMGAWASTVLVFAFRPEWIQPWNFGMLTFVRWLTLVPATLAILLMVWSLNSQLRLSEQEGLVVQGPYHWCRHPFDLGCLIFVLSVGLLCANWLILVVSFVASLSLRGFGLASIDARRAVVLGLPYTTFVSRTGVFFPVIEPMQRAQYQVPSRFGLTAILGLLTILAMIFGALKASNAQPAVYLFVGSEIMAICLAQILFGSAPRGSSAITGAILLPFWVILTIKNPPASPTFWFVLTPTLILFGGLLGYCIGVLAAGFFLVTDLVEHWLTRRAEAYPPFPKPDSNHHPESP